MKKKNNNKFNLPKTKKSNNKLYKSANNEFSTNLLAVKKFRNYFAARLRDIKADECCYNSLSFYLLGMKTSLNLKPNQMFLTTKYKVQAKYFKESELRAILQELCNLDYNFKSGKIDLQVGIETILCRYCS